MGSRWYAVVVDSTDPARLGRWWAEVLGFRILDEQTDELMVGGDSQPVLYFTKAAESTAGDSGAGPRGKVGRNRLHLDLDADDRDAEVERLVNMGARHVDIGRDGDVVLADPEGNEFCVLGTRPSEPGPRA
jgi:hypothetical protein